MARKMGEKGNWMWDRRMEGGEGQRGKLEAGERDGVSGRLTGRIGERDGREAKLDVGERDGVSGGATGTARKW